MQRGGVWCRDRVYSAETGCTVHREGVYVHKGGVRCREGVYGVERGVRYREGCMVHRGGVR